MTTNLTDSAAQEAEASRIAGIVARQRAAYLADGMPDAAQRHDRIDRAIGLLVDHQQEIIETVASDFGHRSHDFTRGTDVLGPLMSLKHARQHLAYWMKPEPRSAPRGEAWVAYQPLGVVGIMSPWNFPVGTAFLPLAGALAAGNRVVIKPSEFTPANSALMARMVASVFDQQEVAVVCGGAETGMAFSGQRFDHLLFTGSGSVGRHVMRAAADNLVPVTLELGGKSPTIVSRSADLEFAVRRIMAGKLHNAGQICLAPDYVFVPEEMLDAFVDTARRVVAELYPSLHANPDYTAIVNERHRARLLGYLDDARRDGARIIELNPAGESFDGVSPAKMVPALVIDPSGRTRIMQDEIFGPLLPVKHYRTLAEVASYIGERPAPLALYYFGTDANEEAWVLAHTTSGGVTVNGVIRHGGVEELPFGGVGASGMGAYRGFDGFKRFSHARAVLRSSAQDIDVLQPPYSTPLRQMMKSMVSR
nr:coniferyl aldehyde dehydrogenase [uncultured Cupriavidus sp.]